MKVTLLIIHSIQHGHSKDVGVFKVSCGIIVPCSVPNKSASNPQALVILGANVHSANQLVSLEPQCFGFVFDLLGDDLGQLTTLYGVLFLLLQARVQRFSDDVLHFVSLEAFWGLHFEGVFIFNLGLLHCESMGIVWVRVPAEHHAGATCQGLLWMSRDFKEAAAAGSCHLHPGIPKT